MYSSAKPTTPFEIQALKEVELSPKGEKSEIPTRVNSGFSITKFAQKLFDFDHSQFGNSVVLPIPQS